MNSATTATTEMANLKTKLKATWMAGDFAQIARSYETGAADFVARLNLAKGARALDVACGSGNLAIPAARAGAVVTGADIVANLLTQGRERAEAEGLTIQFDEADAEQLPYADASFDAVISMFGVMFAPRPEKVAEELTRVCRSGGRIALANWVSTGFVGQMFKTTGAYVPPSPLMPSPMLWGDEATVLGRLNDQVTDVRFTRQTVMFTFPFAPTEVVEFWRTYYGPTNRAFEALQADAEKQSALRRDLETLWAEHNRAMDGTTRVIAEYLEVTAIRI